jgi:hypothetical protein
MMTELPKTNESDIFSGCGNGVLDISISRGIAENNNDWDTSRGDRWLNVCINDDDLEAISLEIFRLVTGKPYNGKENILKLRNDDRQWFARTFPEFPMLGRINYIYEDAYFNAEEVQGLREECVKIKSSATNPSADLGLRKLIYSCDEAIKFGFCLGMWCD